MGSDSSKPHLVSPSSARRCLSVDQGEFPTSSKGSTGCCQCDSLRDPGWPSPPPAPHISLHGARARGCSLKSVPSEVLNSGGAQHLLRLPQVTIPSLRSKRGG